MFGKKETHIFVSQPSVTEYVTQTVKHERAPTDESVWLLKELEESAQNKVLQSIRIEDNEFNCVVHLQYDILNFQVVGKVIYTLNGNKHIVNVYVPKDKATPEVFANKVIEEVSKAIACEVLNGVFNAEHFNSVFYIGNK